MSGFLKKRRPTTSGTGVCPSPCTDPVIAVLANPLTFHSQETTGYRCHKDVFRHCEGVGRRFSAPQIVSRRYKCPHKTLRSAFLPNHATIPLTHGSQQSKDIEEKLGDLIPWLTKLKDSVATPSADGNLEEAERRKQLTQLVSHLFHLVDSSQPSADPWKTLRKDLRRC